MKREDKKLFDEQFNIFWQRLTKKKKMSDKKKAYYQRIMFNHFTELNKILNVDDSLLYVFRIPRLIILFNETNQLRRSKGGYLEKYCLAIMEYFFNNEVSEYAACQYVFINENKPYKNLNTFIRSFRRWYQDLWNQVSFPQVHSYLKELSLRESQKKFIISTSKKEVNKYLRSLSKPSSK